MVFFSSKSGVTSRCGDKLLPKCFSPLDWAMAPLSHIPPTIQSTTIATGMRWWSLASTSWRLCWPHWWFLLCWVSVPRTSLCAAWLSTDVYAFRINHNIGKNAFHSRYCLTYSTFIFLFNLPEILAYWTSWCHLDLTSTGGLRSTWRIRALCLYLNTESGTVTTAPWWLLTSLTAVWRRRWKR